MEMTPVLLFWVLPSPCFASVPEPVLVWFDAAVVFPAVVV